MDFEGLLKDYTTTSYPFDNPLERVFKFRYVKDNNFLCPFCGKVLFNGSIDWADWFKKIVDKGCDCNDWKIRQENYKRYLEIDKQIADLEAEKDEILKSTKAKNIQSVIPRLKEAYLSRLKNQEAEFDSAAEHYMKHL